MVSVLQAFATYVWGPHPSVFEPHPSQCLAGCHKRDYHELIVTKCNHVFCETCLKAWFREKQVCPLHTSYSLPGIETEEGLKEYTFFKEHLDRFTYYIQNDFSTLKDKLAAEKLLSIAQCKLLKAARQKPEKKDQDATEDQCSICTEIPFQMYFIIKDANPNRIGRHMHEDCWQSTVDDQSEILDISVRDLVKVSQKLPWPLKQPDPQPSEPISPIKIFFLATIIPMSICAYAMNKERISLDKSVVLFVLSIPALVILQIFSLLLSGLKAVFKDKHAIS